MGSDWRQQKKQELRRELYQAALSLFERNGYDQTTVQQITDKVGVAKGTFFNHFPTKEHVVAEWYNGVTVDCLERARTRRAPTAEVAICELCADMAQRAQDTPALMMAKARNSGHPLLVAAEKTQDDEIDAFVLEQCRLGKTSGELASDLDASFFMLLLGDLLTGTSRAWVASGTTFDFPALIRARIQFIFRAARPNRD